ncbi:MAG: tetratricopeptide repeat protein [bacterium]
MSFIGKKALSILPAIVFLALTTLLVEGCQLHRTPDARLTSPVPLLQEILKSTDSPVFITPEFFPSIASLSGPQVSLLPSVTDSESAARDKSAFWKMNRERHFGAVFLGASPAWQSLTKSLLASSLWTLTDLSPWGYLFRPKGDHATDWQLPSDQKLREIWPDTKDRARYMMLTASNLAEIGRLSEATQLLDMAATTKELPSLLLSTRASLSASQGHWQDAAGYAKKSLDADTGNHAAREILIRALIETGSADEALDNAQSLITLKGENENSLFLLARAANAANSGKEETDALLRLVTLARRHREPLGASLTYLGQAYAKQGERGNALRAFQEAALAPELSDEQHGVIRELMDHIMEGNASSSTLPTLKKPLDTNP